MNFPGRLVDQFQGAHVDGGASQKPQSTATTGRSPVPRSLTLLAPSPSSLVVLVLVLVLVMDLLGVAGEKSGKTSTTTITITIGARRHLAIVLVLVVVVLVLLIAKKSSTSTSTSTSTNTIGELRGSLPHVALGRSHPASDRRIRCLSISNNSSMLRSRFLAWAINFD
jgi:hypothetical protein